MTTHSSGRMIGRVPGAEQLTLRIYDRGHGGGTYTERFCQSLVWPFGVLADEGAASR